MHNPDLQRHPRHRGRSWLFGPDVEQEAHLVAKAFDRIVAEHPYPTPVATAQRLARFCLLIAAYQLLLGWSERLVVPGYKFDEM